MQTPGMHHLARAPNRFALLHILTAQPNVLKGFHALGDFHAIRLHARVLLHHHGIGARRHEGSGKNPQALSRLQGAPERTARRHLADALQLRARAGFSGDHRVAVHSGIVEPRQIHRRRDVRGGICQHRRSGEEDLVHIHTEQRFSGLRR